MMIRRTIAVIAGFLLSVGMLSACATADSIVPSPAQDTTSATEEVATEEAAPEDLVPEEGITPAPAPQLSNEPPAVEPEPFVMGDSLVMVSELDVDTSNFTSPVTIFGFELMNAEPDAVDPLYFTVGLTLSDHDWKEFARQAGFDSSDNPDRVQLDNYTANSLYDLNTLAGEIMDYQQSRGQLTVDIHEVETYWRLVVL